MATRRQLAKVTHGFSRAGQERRQGVGKLIGRNRQGKHDVDNGFADCIDLVSRIVGKRIRASRCRIGRRSQKRSQPGLFSTGARRRQAAQQRVFVGLRELLLHLPPDPAILPPVIGQYAQKKHNAKGHQPDL